MQEKILIRKDLRTLDKWESERFWACLIYLNIMPPAEINKKTGKPLRITQAYGNHGNGPFEPMNRYDEFISSHASVCEHGTNYFAHYHRHLLSVVELTLNEADLYLRKRKHFPEFNKENYGPLFERAFDRYAQIIAGCEKELEGKELPMVAIHYWNPLDYQKGLNFPTPFQPEEKKKRIKEKDPFWELHRKYLNCDFGERDFKYTWNKGKKFQNNNTWSSQQKKYKYFLQPYTEQQQAIIEGQNLRQSNPKRLIKDMKKLQDKIKDQNYHKSMLDIQKNDKVPLHLINQRELNIQYGGGQFSWFTNAELQKIHGDGLTYYNKLLPHYSYAQSLRIKNINFCSTFSKGQRRTSRGFQNYAKYEKNFLISFQNSHDIMHDNLAFSMTDGAFSILNPLFMVYHSYVDYMTELKIRLVNQDPKKQAFQSLNEFFNWKFDINKESIRRHRRKQVQTFLQYLWINYKINTYGDYPLLQWLDTTQIITMGQANQWNKLTTQFRENENVQTCKTYKDFILYNNQTIRQTNEQSQFYKGSKYDNIIQGFPFSYNYDILPLDKKKQFLIPTYLNEIIEAINQQEETFDQKVGLRKRNVQGFLLPEVRRAIKDKNLTFEQKQKVAKRNEKIRSFNKLFAFIKYPSSLKNQSFNLSLKIKDWKSFNFNNCRALSKDLYQRIIEGDGTVPIELFSVFTKQSDSHQCPRCQGLKADIKELCDQFRGYFYPFYIDLMVNSNYGFIYDSRNKQNEKLNIEKSFSQLVEFVHESSDKEKITFQHLEGASEVTFKVKFIHDVNQEGSSSVPGSAYLDLRGFVYEAKSNQQMFSVPYSSIVSSSSEIHFKRNEDSSSLEHTKFFFYHNFHCRIVVNGNVHEFDFALKNYMEAPVYTIFIDFSGNVVIQDEDLYEKRNYLF